VRCIIIVICCCTVRWCCNTADMSGTLSPLSTEGPGPSPGWPGVLERVFLVRVDFAGRTHLLRAPVHTIEQHLVPLLQVSTAGQAAHSTTRQAVTNMPQTRTPPSSRHSNALASAAIQHILPLSSCQPGPPKH
jgi:hypothetical protein